jgi:TPR repeat protein
MEFNPPISGISSYIPNVSNILPFVNEYKYWILGLVIAIVLIFFATKAENNSQEALMEEITAQQNLIKKKIPINYKKIGDLYFKQYTTGNGDRKQGYVKAIENYEKCFQNDVTVCLALAKMFHNGLTDTYDRSGNKVPGIPPSAEKSIFFYTKASQLGDGDALLQMADIYHWGLSGFNTNKEYAKQLYVLLRKIGNEYQKGIAKDRLLQIKEEDGTVIGSGLSAAGAGLDQGDKYESYGQNVLDEDFDPEIDNADKNVEQLSHELGLNHKMNQNIGIEKFENNPHNVTDHVIDNTVKQVIAKLKPVTPILFQEQQTFRDIKRWILAQRSGEDKKRDALIALEEIGKSLNQRSYDETLEVEALQLVWNRIHSNVNSRNRNVLKQNFFNELAECIEYGSPVCRKGRITRLVDVLNGVDPEVNIKPKWALNEEMFRQAATLREDAIKLAKPEIRDAIMSPHPSPDQIQLCQSFQDRFKKDLVRDLFAKYVDTGLMSKELLKTEIGKWINTI